MTLMTESQKYRAERNRQMYDEWVSLTEGKETSRTMTRTLLMNKYLIFSVARFYEIIKEQARLAQSQE